MPLGKPPNAQKGGRVAQAGDTRVAHVNTNARDEYVTTVALDSTRGSQGAGATANALTGALSSKWVIADYTRDPEILGAMAGDPAVLTLVSVKGQDKLKSFRRYLAERKKAGVVKLPDGGGSIFLLPSTDHACVQGESILVLFRHQGGVHAETSAAGAIRRTVKDATTTAAGGVKEVTKSDGSGGAGGVASGGFLGSLMGTLKQTHKSVAGTNAVDRVNKAQDRVIRNKVERFKAEVREKLQAFAIDPSAISHKFPSVEKSLRSIQHAIVEDFDGITTRTEGDTDDRHVVVYKLGYEPPEEDVQLDPQFHISTTRKKSSSVASAGLAAMPAILGGSASGIGDGADGPSAPDLVRIGTVVKDRRSVQDIEEARKAKRRKGLGDEDGSQT